MTSDDTFLNRWSRRKRQADEPDPVPQPAEEQAVAPEPDPEKSDAEILDELGLSDPDAMEPGDDFSGFMAKAVPERLRNRALRKLWLTNPVLANLDELVDYGDDFTDAATVIENLQTVYRVGQGMIDRTAPDDDDEPEDSSSPETEAPVEDRLDADEEIAPVQENSAEVEEEPNSVRISQDFAVAEAQTQHPVPRRMSVRFDEE